MAGMPSNRVVPNGARRDSRFANATSVTPSSAARRPGRRWRMAANPNPASAAIPRRNRLPNRAAARRPCIGGNRWNSQPYIGVRVPSDSTNPIAVMATSIRMRRRASPASSWPRLALSMTNCAPESDARKGEHDDPRKERVHGIAKEAAAPGVEVDSPRGREVAFQRRRVVRDGLERAYHPLIPGDAVVGDVDGKRREAGQRGGEGEGGQDASRPARPVGGAREDDDRDHDAAEDEEVSGRVGHGRHPDREPDRITQQSPRDDAIRGEEREWQPPRVNGLDVREARERMGIEREHRAGQQTGRSIAGPGDHERRGCPRGQGEPGDEHDVEYQDRGCAEPL